MYPTNWTILYLKIIPLSTLNETLQLNFQSLPEIVQVAETLLAAMLL